jgi:hypothetical protein
MADISGQDMASQRFEISYDGEALRDGRMPVTELAGALLAAGKLIEEANRVVNGESYRVSVTVRTVRPGSCTIELLCHAANAWSAIKDLVMGEDAQALAALLEWLGVAGGGGVGLFKVIKWLRNRHPRNAVTLENGNIRLILEDGEEIEIHPKVLELLRSIPVRRAVSDMTKPLEKEGIDTLSIGTAAERSQSVITKADLPAFAPPLLNDEPITSNTFTKAYSILSLAFKDDNKWRLSDGNTPVSVLIADKEFLDKVNKDEISFAKNDVLICEVKMEQWQSTSGIKTDYTVLRVIQHKSAARQLPIVFPEQ